MEFKDKTAVVTGSSGGIGKAIAIALAREGTDIVLASRNIHNLEIVKKEIDHLGRRAMVIQCDVSSDESVAAMKEKAIKALVNIDILVNNAAVGVRGLLEYTSLDDWRYIINTNLMGYIRNVTEFLPHFLKRGSGYIVNVSSIQALTYGSDTLNTLYTTTKAGILGFSDCLSAYLSPKGIKVSCLIPGGVATEISHNTRFVGTEEQKEKMWDDSEKFWASGKLLTSIQLAEGLLQGMKREEYIILVPDNMVEMIKPQGRDVTKLNTWIANTPPL
jgi:3-oxoacyl-[acyl-carrier protein] reductase